MDISIYWAGRAETGSTYRIERATVDLDTWTLLAASRSATAPYTSPESTIAGNVSHGAATVTLSDAAAFSSSGKGWLDDALLEWTGKSDNSLTGVVWRSGYGTYADGSDFYEAHETYIDTGVAITANAVVYRITHIDADGNESAPAYLWYYSPPKPESSQHCVVVVAIGADLGVAVQSGVTTTCQLKTDDQFGATGGHLDANSDPVNVNTQSSNSLGLTFFQCWKSSARSDGLAPYEFVLKPGAGELKVLASLVPDRDWVLLSQIVDSE
jgi:hypothetical protein